MTSQTTSKPKRAAKAPSKPRVAKTKVKSRRVNKTKTLMLNQTPAQNADANLRIEVLLTGELKDTIKYHLGKYGKTFERKLGLTRDDLLNDMREQIWKGLLTHSPSGGANLKTWLNRLISNRFLVLLKRSTIQKHNSVDYYGDVFSTTGIDDETLMTEETGETIFEKRQIIAQEFESLNKEEKLIYFDMTQGRGLSEMVEKRKMSPLKVTGMINKLSAMIASRIKG